jgi:hypothetical protein
MHARNLAPALFAHGLKQPPELDDDKPTIRRPLNPI